MNKARILLEDSEIAPDTFVKEFVDVNLESLENASDSYKTTISDCFTVVYVIAIGMISKLIIDLLLYLFTPQSEGIPSLRLYECMWVLSVAIQAIGIYGMNQNNLRLTQLYVVGIFAANMALVLHSVYHYVYYEPTTKSISLWQAVLMWFQNYDYKYMQSLKNNSFKMVWCFCIAMTIQVQMISVFFAYKLSSVIKQQAFYKSIKCD